MAAALCLVLASVPGACSSPSWTAQGVAERGGSVDYPGLRRPVAPAPAPEIPEPAVILDRQSRLGLRILRARAVRAALEKRSRLVVPGGPYTFGESIPLELQLGHPLSEAVSILAGEPGPAVVLQLRIRRWLPLGARETLEANPVVRLQGPILLPPGQTWSLQAPQELGPDADAASIWEVSVAGTLRCDGVRIGDEDLPIQEVHLQPSRFLALPDGWRAVAGDPAGTLRRAVGLADTAADRHLLVAAALLPAERRREGIGILMEGLDASPGVRRVLTILAALRWLTGEDLGESPVAWQQWWRRQGTGGTP